jgi:hypothetical protein
MDKTTIYYVNTEADGKEQPRLIRASSKSAARSKALSIVTVRKALQEDILLALAPSNLPIEDAE